MTNDELHHASTESDGVATSNQPSFEDDAAASRRWTTKAIIWTASGVVATLIGIAAIAVPIVADAQRRATSTDTLALNPTTGPDEGSLPTSTPLAAEAVLDLDVAEVSTKPRPDGPGVDMKFWVPVDAPWATFPDDGWAQEAVSNVRGCSQAQFDWLVAHAASRATQGGLFDFVNTAAEGGALSIRSIRAEGEFVAQDPPRIQVDCNGGGYGEGDDYTVVEVTLGADSPATIIASSVLPVGSVFSRDLAPGEVGQLVVMVATLDPQQDFEGRIVADVVAGTSESTITIEEGVLWRSAPAVRAGIVNIDGADGILRCVTLPVPAPLFEDSTFGGGPFSTMPQYYAPNDGWPCTPAELEEWIGGLAVEY